MIFDMYLFTLEMATLTTTKCKQNMSKESDKNTYDNTHNRSNKKVSAKKNEKIENGCVFVRVCGVISQVK